MGLSPEELLQKATLSTTDFGSASGNAPLSLEQQRQFLRIAIERQMVLPDVRTVMSAAATWEESKIDFSKRIMRPGVEATRLGESDRVKPDTGVIQIITKLHRAEVPVSDETLEDQVERAGFGNTIMTMVAEGVGRDIEELMLNGDTDSTDSWLAQYDGWIKQAQGTGGNIVDATNMGQDYQTVFKQLINVLPNRFKRNKGEMRFYVPMSLEENYRDILAARGTALGDMTLEGGRTLRYQEIEIKGVSLQGITAGSPDRSSILLTHRRNLYAGYHRRVRMESWRDPREGVTSFIATARTDAKIAVVEATAVATNVDVEP